MSFLVYRMNFDFFVFIKWKYEGLYHNIAYLLFNNPFHASGLFLYSLKTLENHWFSNVFRGYRKGPVALNVLTSISLQ